MSTDRVFARALVLCAVVGIAPHPATAIPPAAEKWIEVRSPSFRFISNASPKRTTEIAVRLERFRAVFDGDSTVSSARSLLPTVIVVFKNAEAFAPYKRQEDGTPGNYVGLFVPGRDGNFIGFDAGEGDRSFETIYHEYVHYSLSKRYLDVPLWVHEGMAEFWSTFEVDEVRAEIGRPVELYAELLVRMRMPLIDILLMGTYSPDYHGGVGQALFYAQSWALYHYIVLGRPDLKPRLVTFLDELDPAVPVNATFEAAFGQDSDVVERDVLTYIRAGEFPYQTIRLEELEERIAVRVETLARAEQLYVLAEYLSHATPWQGREIQSHLEEAIAADPGHARAHATLAVRHSSRDRRADAQREFLEAIRLAPGDDLPVFLFAMDKLQRALESSSDLLAPPAEPLAREVQDARELFRQALERNPERVEAHVGLGQTYALDPGPVTDGIAALERARFLEPTRMDIALWLMVLYVRIGDREATEGMAQLVHAHSKDPMHRKLADYVLARDSYARIVRAHEARRAEERRLNEARQDVERSAAVRQVEAELEAAKARRLQVDLYNDAVRKTKAGDVTGALRILQGLKEPGDDPELAKRIRDLRQKLEAHVEQNRDQQLLMQALEKVDALDYTGAIAILEQLIRTTKNPESARRADKVLVQVRALEAARSGSQR
jgi:hypothetical protein